MGSKKSEPVSAEAAAQDQLKAQLATTPQAMQLSMDMASKYMQPYTQLQEDVRQNVFTQESDVRNQMMQNILASLISPTGISPEQQTAIDTRRATSQDQLVQSMRERANLGGGLFGGRAANAEQKAVGDLQNQFAEEDINRETTARLNAIQAALPALQLLFPGINISAPQFQSAVAGGSDVYSGKISQANTQATNETNQNIARNEMLASLFQNMGKTAGAAMSGGG